MAVTGEGTAADENWDPPVARPGQVDDQRVDRGIPRRHASGKPEPAEHQALPPKRRPVRR
jgi:hypothetical protein